MPTGTAAAHRTAVAARWAVAPAVTARAIAAVTRAPTSAAASDAGHGHDGYSEASQPATPPHSTAVATTANAAYRWPRRSAHQPPRAARPAMTIARHSPAVSRGRQTSGSRVAPANPAAAATRA